MLFFELCIFLLDVFDMHLDVQARIVYYPRQLLTLTSAVLSVCFLRSLPVSTELSVCFVDSLLVSTELRPECGRASCGVVIDSAVRADPPGHVGTDTRCEGVSATTRLPSTGRESSHEGPNYSPAHPSTSGRTQ